MTPSDVKIVAENINDFIEVPNSVSRLRNAVLTLAISGNFTPAGCSSWSPLKLGDVCSVKKGKRPELYDVEDEEMLPYLEAKFIRGTRSAKFAKISDKNSVIVAPDDLIIICDGSNSGEFFTGVNGVLASTMGVLIYDKNTLSKQYLEIFLKCNFDLLNRTRKGAAIPHLDFKLFNSLHLILPPLEVQKQIIEKLQLVMKQIDKLESQKNERDFLRSRLSKSAMQALVSTGSKISFEVFTELVKNRQDIKELENSIFSLAVSGKLLPQYDNEGTGQLLFDKIEADKIKEAGSKKPKRKEFTEIVLKDAPVTIPDSWKWVRLGQVALDITYGTSFKTSDEGEVPVLRMGNISPDGVIRYSNLKYVSSSMPDLPKLYLKNGDLVFNRTNSYELVGKSGVFDRNESYTLASYLIRVRFHPLIDSKYISYYINSQICRRTQIEPNIVQQNGQANFNGTKLANILVPLPSVPEQKRIVKKVEELMTLINHLKRVIE